MFDSKYSKVLTVILVLVIIAIIGLLCFFGYDFYQKYFIEKETADFVDSYNQDLNNDNENTVDENTTTGATNPIDQIEETPNPSGSGSTKKTYKGYVVMGTMEIPKTNFKYPVLERVTPKAIETSVAILYGVGLNQPGNTVIVGHNYRNGLFFSNNKKLSEGDKIYITDNSGKKLTYTIYSKFETTSEDTSFYQRDTNGKAEVTLSTCTDDSSARIIILARED